MLPLYLNANESYDKYVQPKLIVNSMFKTGREFTTFAALVSENNYIECLYLNS